MEIKNKLPEKERNILYIIRLKKFEFRNIFKFSFHHKVREIGKT